MAPRPARFRRAMLPVICRAALAVLLVFAGGEPLQAQTPPPFPTQLPGGHPRPAKNRHPRLDSTINKLILEAEARGEGPAVRSAPLSRDSSVAVVIHFSGAPSEAQRFLRTRGALIANIGQDVIEAYVPVRALAALERLPGLLNVRTMFPPRPLATSQGTTVHNSPAWNSFGFNGAGVKVGIIDGGFQGYGGITGPELPAPAGVRCYVGIGSFTSNFADCQTETPHGTAVAEAVVDIAPGVSLYLSQPIGFTDLQNTVQWMISQGVTVINHFMGWIWSGPGDGTSPYSNSPLASVNSAVVGGSLWVNAAGNEGGSTWTGSYSDQNADYWLEFAAGTDLNPVYVTAGQTLIVQARWQNTWLYANTDLDVGLYDDNLALVAYSADSQNGTYGSIPHEAFAFTPLESGVYYLALYHYAGPVPGWIQLQNFSGHPLTYYTPYYSIGSPGDSSSPGALAVGATPWYSNTTIEPFSSQGPTMDGRVKPDVVGADRGNSATYPSGFAGTSQAAPHVAGLAALVRHRFPSYSPGDVALYLKNNAQPRGGGVNFTWGWGLAFLPTPACSFVLNPASRSIGAGGGTGSITVTADCPWTAVSNAGWLTITGGSSGMGNGTVSYSVASNASTNLQTPQRTGTITIGNRTFIVTQAGCAFIIEPTATTYDASGGSGSVNVIVAAECPWNVTSVPAWAATISGASGTGPGRWEYSVSTNGSGSFRSGSMWVAGQPFTLNQLAITAKPLVAGSRTALALPDQAAAWWGSAEVVAGRSYCVALISAPQETSRSSPALAAFHADGSSSLNGAPGEETSLPSLCFVAQTSETALFRVTQTDTSMRNYLLTVRETTVWSNWFFIGGDYSSFTLLRNTSGNAVNIDVRWRDGAGTIVGQQTGVIPARGMWFRDARSLVAAGALSGTVEVAHDGPPAAIVGSQTTLSGGTGLSFDTLLIGREP